MDYELYTDFFDLHDMDEEGKKVFMDVIRFAIYKFFEGMEIGYQAGYSDAIKKENQI